MEQTYKKLTLSDLLEKLTQNSKKILREFLLTGEWNDQIDALRAQGFFISLGVAANNEGIAGVGLSEPLKQAALLYI